MTFEFGAVTLPGLADPAVAIAASRAGAIGIVDVSSIDDPQLAVAAVRALARFGRHRCGVRLDPRDEATADAVIPVLRAPVGLVVLTPDDPGLLRHRTGLLRAAGAEVWLEVTTVQEARLAVDLGVDAVVAKGHEAGGRVAETTTFVLLQQLLAEIALPVWAHGGIGEHSAAGCAVAGAAGVLLDGQFALTRESRLPAELTADIARMDGSETVCVGQQGGERYRVYARPGTPAAAELRRLAGSRRAEDADDAEQADDAERAALRAALAELTGRREVWLLGQDVAFAARLAERFRTVGGVLTGLRDAVDEHLVAARRLRPLDAGGPLASSHGTRYPIVQGPMTRVSDVPGFAHQVAEAGALPFLALAVMRGPQVEELLRRTQEALGERPWGVGILGFVPPELRTEQLEVLERYPPSFALIAGGRPDQARQLEQRGIPTYLHVPSPGLLSLFAESGARRFVFEGRECGGHVGPRTSFVLWDTMIDTLLASVPPADLPECHVLFAGGIHDARSAAMVAAMAATLAQRGVRVGVLLGTAYLFTEEAVSTGAITAGFQREALSCTGTVLLESGPGHATRCADTAFAAEFEREQRRLHAESRSADDVRERLEQLSLGRLRIASKGIDRHPGGGHEPGAPEFAGVTPDEQAARGMYMLGQVAALRAATVTLAALHHDVSVGGSALLTAPAPAQQAEAPLAAPCDIAIVGMSCLLPKAPSLGAYWQNILDKVDAITEIPADRWDWQRYFDPDPRAPDKIYSRWGGFLDRIPFDPLRYGMPPTSLRSIEPMQLLTLEAVRAALDDAGYRDRPFPRQQTGVILGAGGLGDLGNQYSVRAALPAVLGAVAPDVLDTLPTWTEDSFPGILPNVTAGRVANRFDLGGVNHTVDAACASSLAAIYLAVRELETGTADVMVAGGADTMQSPFGYLCFSKTPALSPRGRCRPFDASADGIVISEGIGIVVLKRLADAERDGDRIYAVIKGVGGSSDGRDKGLTAPRPEGQTLALQRAYAKAGFPPATVGLIEAHGTGTVVGDRTEVQALTRFFGAAGAPAQGCAIGSVKSMIGHTKGTAGVAGLIKVALGLHHKVLPPTLGVERPNTTAGFAAGPCYVNSEARPWLRAPGAAPRRAGVSAFGFGGTNFHVAVEEYDDYLPGPVAPLRFWPSELFCWTAGSRAELGERLAALDHALDGAGTEPALPELARAVWEPHRGGPVRLAVIATSLADLRTKLAKAREVLAAAAAGIWDRTGVYLTTEPLACEGAVAFLYPGQGSQHPDMLRDLAISFAEVREAFERADAAVAAVAAAAGQADRPLSAAVFAPPGFGPDDAQARADALTRTDRAQPALGAAEMGLSRLLANVGVTPGMTAGHSYGEYVALCRAGALDEDLLYQLSAARGRSILDTAEGDHGTMAAVSAGPQRVAEVLGRTADTSSQVWIANLNAPEQTVISGTRSGIEQALLLLSGAGVSAQQLPVACGFHSPLVAPARDRFAAELARVEFAAPLLPVYANTSAAPYPAEPDLIRELLADHLVTPVRFADQIERMYAAGARLFVEVGPRAVLTGLTRQVLGTRAHLAVPTQGAGHGLTGLQHALGQLHAHGVEVDLERLYRGRVTRRLRPDALAEDLAPAPLPATTWLVDGGSARPLGAQGHVIGPGTAETRPASEPQPAVSPRTAQPATPVSSAPPPGEGADEVVLRFQQLMNKFLDTQHDIMTAYLHGTDPAPPVHGPAAPQRATTTPQPPVPPLPIPPPAAPWPDGADPAGNGAGPAATAVVPDAGQIGRELVRLAADRTGYPPEMLDLDADLEADLGIDSIKRVEILGAAQQSLSASDDVLSGGMDALAKARTLRTLAEAIAALLGQGSGGNPASAEPASPAAEIAPAEVSGAGVSGAGVADLPRFTATVLDAPLGEGTLPLRGVVAITDDEQGVAADLAASLRRDGVEVALIRASDSDQDRDTAPDEYAACLGDPAAARALVESIHHRQGPISALVHLLPLRACRPFEDLGIDDWRARLDQETRSLLHLAQAMSADLRRPGPATRVLAAIRLDGAFGHHRADATSSPSHGGVAGLVKTLALEWPQVRCRVVDLGPALTDAAAQLAAELRADDATVEAGWSDGRRVTIGLAAAPLPARDIEASPPHGCGLRPLDADSVLVVTGGAQGITARVTCELARRYRPTVILLGRSPMPGAEPADTAGITDPRALRAALCARLRQDGAPVMPSQVEPAHRRLLADREMRATLAACTEAGARVHYHQVDVRDPEALTRFVTDVYAAHGRIDGVIHGAGVIEDTLIEDKTSDSFARVLDTKAVGAFVLARALRPESLRFLLLFSSISARFGNQGQGDYAAANEVLNKLACRLDAHWPGRVAALLWGPWQAAGMVSEEVRRRFADRGIELVDPDRGAVALVDELERGRKGDVEVLLGAGPWQAIAQPVPIAQPIAQPEPIPPPTTPPSACPLLTGATIIPVPDGIEVTRTLDPQRDHYLDDHRLDGHPVLPAAAAMELMAEVAAAAHPGHLVAELRDVQILTGIVLGEGPRPVTVRTAAPRTLDDSLAHGGDRVLTRGRAVHVTVADVGTGRTAYRAEVVLRAALPTAPPGVAGSPGALEPYPVPLEQVYRELLFHGPLMRGITRIEGIGEHGMVATLAPSRPQQCVAGGEGRWIVDPVLIDSGFQLCVVWARTRLDMTPLPSRIRRYRRFAAIPDAPVRCELRARVRAGGHLLDTQYAFRDTLGRLLALIEDMEGACSRSLNRLAGALPGGSEL